MLGFVTSPQPTQAQLAELKNNIGLKLHPNRTHKTSWHAKIDITLLEAHQAKVLGTEAGKIMLIQQIVDIELRGNFRLADF